MSQNTNSSLDRAAVQLAQPGSDGVAAPAVLTVNNLRYSYPATRAQGPLLAVQDVSLVVQPGTVTSIVGPSGCGKSTLLSLIAGLQPPEGGSVVWTPNNTAALLAKKQRLFTMVFQKDTVLPWLKVDSNIGWGLRYLQMSSAEREERIAHLLELVGLADFRKSYPYQLSGGMRRRVAFLTGVAPMPQVMLLDEPFSALDEPTRVNIHVEVMRIVAELGMAIVLVTHDLSEAITMSDQVCILTGRPARVAKVFDLPFGRDRDVRGLRETDEYQDLYKKMWHELNVQSGLAAPAEDK